MQAGVGEESSAVDMLRCDPGEFEKRAVMHFRQASFYGIPTAYALSGRLIRVMRLATDV